MLYHITKYFKIFFIVPLISLITFSGCNKRVGDNLPELFLVDVINSPLYQISGHVSGLTGSSNFQLQLSGDYSSGLGTNSSSETLALAGNGVGTAGIDVPFTFTTGLHTLTNYQVSISGYPQIPAQFCSIAGDTGTIENNSVSNVVVNCSDGFLVELDVTGDAGTGLLGTGLSLSHIADYGFSEGISIENIGQHAFFTPLNKGATATLSVTSQPVSPWQTCTPSTTSIEDPSIVDPLNQNPVQTIPVSCSTNQYNVGGTIVDLYYTGLQVKLDSNYNGTPDSITVSPGANATIYSLASLYSGATYTASIVAQPTGQNCSLTSGTSQGTIGGGAITIPVNCSMDTILASGSLDSLHGPGFQIDLSWSHTAAGTSGSATLHPAGGSTGYAFSEAIPYGADVSVTISAGTTSTPLQSCSWNGTTGSSTGGSTAGSTHTFVAGTVNVSLPDIICTSTTYGVDALIQGTIIDNVNVELTWNDPYTSTNGSYPIQTLSAGQTGSFDFDSTPVQVPSGVTISALITNQHSAQNCSFVESFPRTVTSAPMTLHLDCNPSGFVSTINLSNYNGSGLKIKDSITGVTDTIPAGTTQHVFSYSYLTGESLDFSIVGQPTSPWQTCFFTGSTSNTFSASNFTISISCTTDQHNLDISIAGTDYLYSSSTSSEQLQITDSYNSAITSISSNGSTNLGTFDSGSVHTLTITNPINPWYSCTFDTGTTSLTTTVQDVDQTININCSKVTGNVKIRTSAFTGVESVTLNYDYTEPDSSSSNGNASFTSADNGSTRAILSGLHAGSTYFVSIASQTTGPERICFISPTPSGATLQPADNFVDLYCTDKAVVNSIYTTHSTQWNKAGVTIPIVITFSKQVTTSGLTLSLNTGATVSCANGTGTAFSCSYTVSNGQNSPGSTTADRLNISSSTAISGTVTATDGTGSAYLTYGGSITQSGGTNVFVDTTPPSAPTITYEAINSVNTVNYQWNRGTDTLSGYKEERLCLTQLYSSDCIPTIPNTTQTFQSTPGTGSSQTQTGSQYKLRIMTVDRAGNTGSVTQSNYIKTGLYLYLSPGAQPVNLGIGSYNNQCNNYANRPDDTANYRALMYTSNQNWDNIVASGWYIYNSLDQMMFQSSATPSTSLAAPVSSSSVTAMTGFSDYTLTCNNWVSPSITDYLLGGRPNSTSGDWISTGGILSYPCKDLFTGEYSYYHYCIQVPR